jgi:hypothetical protein
MAIHDAVMQLRPLGATGLSVTTIGLGLAALGRPEYITPDRDVDLGSARSGVAMEGRCHEMLDLAYRREFGTSTLRAAGDYTVVIVHEGRQYTVTAKVPEGPASLRNVDIAIVR